MTPSARPSTSTSGSSVVPIISGAIGAVLLIIIIIIIILIVIIMVIKRQRSKNLLTCIKCNIIIQVDLTIV